MKKTNFCKTICLALCSVLMLAGCGSSDSSQNSASAEDKSLQKVQDAGKLVLGLDPTFKPMGYTDDNDQIVGFDIDLAKEVCKRMDVKLETYSVNWETKEKDLDAGTIDCIWNGLSVDEKRAKVMLLSKPYMNNSMVFVVKGDSDVKSMSDLSGKKVAVQNGSTAQEILNASELASSITPSELASNAEALNQLDLGMADAVFMDSVVANYEITTSGKNYKLLPDGLEEEEYAIGFRTGDKALCTKVEEILGEMQKDGTIAKISTEWFGSDVTTFGK